VEGDAILDAEALHRLLEVSTLIAAADDVERDVRQLRRELRDGAERDLDVLLGREAADEQDAVVLARGEVGV
jgi:7,8-dihydro-6-hydroxymethylpterin-pyrophosphokinase